MSARGEILLSKIRAEFNGQLCGYISNPTVNNLDSFIVRSDLGSDVGLLGALHIARQKEA